ncbi:NADP-dependent oxidoreductase domain-containing protein [Filobasidium floriforme]|uniref:NADP-dependent oxidoreductase domain-containing protein n=1 Tax=Filobasidium floriforme TaxID=5210 RepID=UPI001E8D1225|nr:NADP-dependent oxidoreductase domain-containing protein [Filobasidium floriforme]KAH8084089.1 NADP-dependent oxidoreductase domain-containing protein [Filobasidium floriforme]
MSSAIETVQNLQGTIKLHDGTEIPQIGLGVYEMSNEEAEQAVYWALEAGYRHVDSAEWYGNEAACGRGIQKFLKARPDISPEDIYYTTKLQTNRSYDQTLKKIQQSLKDSLVDQISLYLLHSPIGGPKVRKACWEACIEAKRQGWVKSIGVSNFGTKHIEEFEQWGLEKPVLNQVDLHPWMRRQPIVDVCRKYGIVLEAWAPLARGMRFNHPVLNEVAKAHDKSPAQILLRWSIQHGFVPIPKSVSQKRIQSNGDLFTFELSQEEMAKLDELDEYLVTDWDVVDVA